MQEVDRDALNGFIAESNDSLQSIESDFIELESSPGDLEIVNRIFRPVHSLKGNSGFFGLTGINKFAHRLENLLDFIRNGELPVTKEIIDILLTGIDHLKNMLVRVHDDQENIELREDEKEFISEIEEIKPQILTGSTQSLIEMEDLIHQVLEYGLSTEDKLIISILNFVEKKNRELQEFIKNNKNKLDTEFILQNNYLVLLKNVCIKKHL